MIEEDSTPEKETPSGRVVYSRLPSEGESRAAGRGKRVVGTGSRSSFVREPLAPTLPTLLVAFVLLILLVFGLGSLSVKKVQDVSAEVQRRDQLLAGRTQVLNNLRDALTQLDNEARDRGTRQAGGGIVNPFDLKLRRARGEAQQQVSLFEHLPLAQTEQGKAFRAEVATYIENTVDAEQYSIEGFKSFRPLEARLENFFAETNKEQEELQGQRLMLSNESARQIRLLTWIAVLLSALIAAATIWEVQRRFRQMRRSLEESRRERQFSSQMLEGMVSAVAAIDDHNRIRSANAAFFQLFPNASVGMSVNDATPAPEASKMFAVATASRVEQVTYHGRWTLKVEAGDDAERTFEVYASPLELDGGHGQIMTLVDVTKTVATETELRHKASLAAVGQAAAQVAHEIKNPLGSIRLGVAMLRDMTQAGEAHETIDLVERGIHHLNKLTIDVTQFSGDKELSLERTDIHQLLEGSLELVADQVQARHVPLEKNYTTDSLEGELDADQLRQVFVNLLVNAIDAGAENSPVSITTALVNSKRAGGDGNSSAANTPHARITIADQGHGMDAKTRARIFDPFFTTKKRGTGLGLAIVKKIIEQHGGTISVESALGEGTSFHVELPLKQK